jgi:hypothetical protein
VNLPRAEDRDEIENWTQDDEDDFCGYFGPLLETIHEKLLSPDDDIQYYNY